MTAFDKAWDVAKEDEMVSITVPKGMVPIIEMMMSNPDIYHDSGYDGNMAGHYGGYSMKRPDMTGFYDPMDEDESPLGDDFTGEYYGDEGNIRGDLSKIKLMDMLRRLIG